jgi:uncharacterized protein YlaI
VSVENITEPVHIPPHRRALCATCGQAVDVAARSTYQRVSGWIQNRRAGGVNHITLMERSPAWMCRDCVDRIKVGVSVNQGALFDERED